MAWLPLALALHAAASLCQGPLVELGPYPGSSAGDDTLRVGLFTSGRCDARQCWSPKPHFDLDRLSGETGFTDVTIVFFMSLIMGIAIAIVSGALELADRAPGARVWLARATLLVFPLGYVFVLVCMRDVRLLPLCRHVLVCCIGAVILQVLAARLCRPNPQPLTPARLLG
jgi:hypothetical protein